MANKEDSPPPAIDPYAGRPGEYIIDPDAGIRVPAEQWAAHQAAKAARAATPPAAPAETLAVQAAPVLGRRRGSGAADTTTTQTEETH
jgi:hypothetical protein